LRTALHNGFGTETTGERLAFPKFTILGEEEIPGLPDGVQIIPADAIKDESTAGQGYYQLGKFQKYAYGDNPLLNALKVPANAASNIVNDAIDILNIPVNDVQYIMEHGGGEYIEARLNTEINWLKGAASALGDLVQYGPRNFMNVITDPDWDAVVDFIKSPLYAENWESAVELGMSMIFGKKPGKLTDDLVDVDPKRGLTFVDENLGTPRNAAQQFARDFESGTSGAFSNISTRQRSVPALRYDNPNPNGSPFVKFDGYQLLDDGVVELIDAKTRIVPFSTRQGPFISPSVRDGLVRKSQALSQNPGYRGVIELPNSTARREAQQVLRQLGITNISTRVR
jgi:hypothetical protein